MKKPLAFFIIAVLCLGFISTLPLPKVKAGKSYGSETLITQQLSLGSGISFNDYPKIGEGLQVVNGSFKITVFSSKLYKVGSPTVNLTSHIYVSDSQFIPIGDALTDSIPLNSSSISGYDFYNFTFATPYLLTNSSYYSITIEIDGTGGLIDGSNYPAGSYQAGNPYSVGEKLDYFVSWQAWSTQDLTFIIYGQEEVYSPDYSNVGAAFDDGSLNLYSYWSLDSGDLDDYTVEENSTGSAVNHTASFSTTPDWANYTVTGLTVENTVIAWKAYANTTDGLSNSTEYYYFDLSLATVTTYDFSGDPQSLYFRSDSYTTNGVSAYGLDTDFTNDYETLMLNYSATASNVKVGFRVYKIAKNGAATEYTSGTPEGVITIATSQEGYNSANWNCPGITWMPNVDALKIVAYYSFDGGSYWVVAASFISNRLNLEEIAATTWTFTVYAATYFATGSAYLSVSFGNSYFKSGILGLEYSTPNIYTSMLNSLVAGDFILFFTIPLESVFGSWAYFILILGVAGAFYIRYRNIAIILTLFILFGVAGGFVGALIPSPVDVAVWVALALGLTGVLWRVFR